MKNAEAAHGGGLLAEAPERAVAQPLGIALAILGKLYDYPRDRRRQWVFCGRSAGHREPVAQRIAVGATVEPVAPCSFSGCMTNANS